MVSGLSDHFRLRGLVSKLPLAWFFPPGMYRWEGGHRQPYHLFTSGPCYLLLQFCNVAPFTLLHGGMNSSMFLTVDGLLLWAVQARGKSENHRTKGGLIHKSVTSFRASPMICQMPAHSRITLMISV